MRSAIPQNCYAHWRMELDVTGFRDADPSGPPEKLLQAIWQHQRLRRDALRTLDGRRVRVLHPGFWNHESGPDFRQALVQFEDEPPVAGDVEVDLSPDCWAGHGHNRNPAFQQVILHVVWTAPGRHTTTRPTLPLKALLDAPLAELGLWLRAQPVSQLPAELIGQCAAGLGRLSPEQLVDLLRQAALVRLQGKAAQMRCRAREAGWEQALWEGLFRALGYKHNTWPMQNLAELRPRLVGQGGAPLHLQARLLGAGGLLPTDLARAPGAADNYLRQLWDYWWREREEFSDCVLPKGLWRLHGLRPANHPQRRLALAAHWLAAGDLVVRLEKWFHATLENRELAATLLERLQVPADDYWTRHWTLRSARLKQVQPLLGEQRVTDLAVNVVLPWLWIRAVDGRQERLWQRAEARYFAWPPGEDNVVLRQARQRLLSGQTARLFRSAAAQQGLLQIVRDFCDHANACCEACRFPELMTQWQSAPA